MNLTQILLHKKIENLTYDSVFTEKPMSDLVDFDYKKILEPPPANTSKIVKKELQVIYQQTSRRTNDDYDLIFRIDEDIDAFYVRLLKSHQLEYPKRYIDLFYDIVEPIVLNTKSYWNRPRPVQLGKLYNIDIEQIVTDTIHTASYPSGHTVYSRLVRNILSDLYPNLSKNFDIIVEKTAEARIKQGVHYPSDNAASIKFSNYIYKKLHPKLRRYYDNS
jgi:plasmid maintenance system killer protein